MPGISVLWQDRARGPEECRLHVAGSRFPIDTGASHEGLVILVAEEDDIESIEAIERHFQRHSFPVKMTFDVGIDGVVTFPQPTYATSTGSESDSWSVIRFRGLDGQVSKYEEGYNDEKEIERDSMSDTAVGTWICDRAPLGQRLIASSLVLLVFRAQSHHVRDYGNRLRGYFNREPEMLHYVRDHPLFIYIVLYQCFNNFNTILYQFENLYKEAALNQERNMYGVFGRCYQLNKGLVSMSYCYPDVLMHKAALKRLRELNGLPERMIPGGARQYLNTLITDIEDDLQDFEAKLGFVSDRFKAALDLEFNLSGERLNLIMMWFTAFAVLFTPIGFVAAVFSIVDADPVWFFISGSIVLVISMGICLWAYTSVVTLGHGMKRSHLRAPLLKLPYQETRMKSKQADKSEPTGADAGHHHHTTIHRERVSRAHDHSHSHSHNAPGISVRHSHHHRRESSASSSGSASTVVELRTTAVHRHQPPRQRSQSSTMMYSRRRTPGTTSVERPEVSSHRHPNVYYAPPPPAPPASGRPPIIIRSHEGPPRYQPPPPPPPGGVPPPPPPGSRPRAPSGPPPPHPRVGKDREVRRSRHSGSYDSGSESSSVA